MFSALSCLPASWSFPDPVFLAQPECWCGSPGVRRSRLSYPISTLTPGSGWQEATQACSRLCAASATSPNWVFSFGVGGGAPQTGREGGRPGEGKGWAAGSGREERAGKFPPSLGGPRRGKDTCPVHLVRDRSGGGGALSPRSPRPPVGGALVMHYSSPSRPPARSPAPRPPPSLSARGLRAAPSSGSEEPSQYCGSSASDGSGEAGVRSLGGGRQALRLGGVQGEGDAGSHGPKGAHAGKGVWFSRRAESLASICPFVGPSIHLPFLPSLFPSVNQHLGSICSGRGEGDIKGNKVETVPSLIKLNLQVGERQIKRM